jgi:hypothetical protein
MVGRAVCGPHLFRELNCIFCREIPLYHSRFALAGAGGGASGGVVGGSSAVRGLNLVSHWFRAGRCTAKCPTGKCAKFRVGIVSALWASGNSVGDLVQGFTPPGC